MTAEKQYFIELLSSYVNRAEPVGKTVDLNELFRLADIHDVGGIISSQLMKLSDEFKPEGELKSKFNQVLGYTIKNNTVREAVFIEIKEFLNKNQIEHIFVKGIIIKDYYPEPELRTSGDIDIIVKEPLEKMAKLAEDNSYKVTNITSDTVTLKVSGLEVEIHNCSDVITDYFDNMFYVCEKDGFEYKLSYNDHLLYLLCHLLKHIIFRGAGIRMLLDMDLMIRSNEFDYDSFIKLCRENNLERAADIILSLCNYWFNTPVAAKEDFNNNKNLLSKLESAFLDGGSFGFDSNTLPLKYYRKNDSKFKIFINLVFPDKEYLKKCYSYYKNNPVLYPVARINRLTDGLFKRRKLAGKAVKDIIHSENADLKLELIEELEISSEVKE